MAGSDASDMDPARALLTQRRQEVLQGDYDDNKRLYEERSRIRKILDEQLTEDVEILIEDDSDLYAQLIEIVLSEKGIEHLREDHPEVFDSLRSDICEK